VREDGYVRAKQMKKPKLLLFVLYLVIIESFLAHYSAWWCLPFGGLAALMLALL
jgi:uncharacterized membrane protein